MLKFLALCRHSAALYPLLWFSLRHQLAGVWKTFRFGWKYLLWSSWRRWANFLWKTTKTAGNVFVCPWKYPAVWLEPRPTVLQPYCSNSSTFSSTSSCQSHVMWTFTTHVDVCVVCRNVTCWHYILQPGHGGQIILVSRINSLFVLCISWDYLLLLMIMIKNIPRLIIQSWRAALMEQRGVDVTWIILIRLLLCRHKYAWVLTPSW